MSFKSTGGEFASRNLIPRKWALFLCACSFCAGMSFTNRMWMMPESKGVARISKTEEIENPELKAVKHESNNNTEKLAMVEQAIQSQDKRLDGLKTKITAVRAERDSVSLSHPVKGTSNISGSMLKRKYFMVIGINTAFSSRKRRDSVRATWMPQGEKRKMLEEAKGIIIRFVIGHSATSGGILDKAIDAEEKMHGDFLRLVMFLSCSLNVIVSVCVHTPATLGMTLAAHRTKPRVYVGCMKSGPVLARKGVKYYEPEYWKFGEIGNKYFRHATGQLYALSKDLATYISINQHLLHKYANEDVSLGSWFIGLDVEHVDDRRLCCDCEWKAQLGKTCVATFDWRCSGICKSVERIKEVHELCGEGEDTLWRASF
ncbi:putative beta-1,3-galactosyltransferase 2 [Citrus sinensis]|uniref:Beta-1,3-galactosyltransferase 2 n=1 Tax=Citrus sinensis TaxID=2711 RepID=A0ACB8NIB5_CITSI|nr:putative beta-1,3-galactosyltransferase 2 [Citrus sinensis]